jgi:hypothetical protein
MISGELERYETFSKSKFWRTSQKEKFIEVRNTKKCKNEGENSQNIRNYTQLIFKGIFPEDRLEEHTKGGKKYTQKECKSSHSHTKTM